MKNKSSISEIKSILRKHSALGDFNTLAESGCDPHKLEGSLEICRMFADNSWANLIGSDLRSFKATIKTIRNCADEIDRLNRTNLSLFLSGIALSPYFVDIGKKPTLSERLREYADALDHCRQEFGPKKSPILKEAIAYLVAYVWQKTKRPHDKEVSSLISAVLKNDAMDPVTHRMWRQTNKKRIEFFGQHIRTQIEQNKL